LNFPVALSNFFFIGFAEFHLFKRFVKNIMDSSVVVQSVVTPTNSLDNTPSQYNYIAQQDAYANYNATGNFFCQNCNQYSQLVEDHRSGDLICSNCGSIGQEKLIGTDAEYRVFSEDSNSYNKIHYSGAYNPFQEYSLTERSKLERDEKEFLWDGLRNINDVLYKLYQGDTINKRVSERAKELFQQAFHLQVEQKKGTVSMKRSGGIKDKSKNRQKFSRRKQFVVTCLSRALDEANISRWKIEDLSNQMDGINVSKYSVDNCMNDLQNVPSFKSQQGKN